MNSNIYAFDAAGRYLRTLHTIGHADKHYEVGRVGEFYTFKEPTKRLNVAAAADSLLYVYSRVKSTTKKKYPHESYIDTYDLHRSYVGSIRVRKNTGNGFSALAVTGDSLFVAEGNQLVLYKKM
ncbi:hypothetical protein [Hymenobacter elongatus]|uniref:Uncharacterized protein n=1 Tax=Hymenobacter elongatus TaxID=877208 RepID=A0A4Z0PHZ7_9BACT|nr:hypothetical protein [Hymenobacter elongatus]TGE14458.1 hypothetical protein E5J99_15980 [Hymenobacter elongatus]